MIPKIEEMFCKHCDQNPTQTIMKEYSILCGFCGKAMYIFTEEDIVKDWKPGWSDELRAVMNGKEELKSEITKVKKNE